MQAATTQPHEAPRLPSLLADALKPLQDYFDDEHVTEIMVNPDGVAWVEREGKTFKTDITLKEVERDVILKQTAHVDGQDCVSDTPSAVVNSIIQGMRISGGLKPFSPQGTFFSIRKHLPPHLRPSMEQLTSWGMCTQFQAQLMERLVVRDKLNGFVVGGTSSGKTTVANALLSKIEPFERLIVIEDSQELHVRVENTVRIKTNNQKGLTACEAVKIALRQKPDRLVLGETRGDETYDLIRAMNSGHDGTLSTIHASSARLGLQALEMLFQMSLPESASISGALAKEYIANAVQFLIFAARRYEKLADGTYKAVRKIEQIVLVKGVKNGDYVLEEI